MNLSEREFLEIVEQFIEDHVTTVTGSFYWPERAAWLVDFDRHPSRPEGDDGPERREPLVRLVLRASYEYATEARWDEAKGAIDEFMLILEIVQASLDIPHLTALSGRVYAAIEAVAEQALARWALDSDEDLSLRQVSLLAGMAEGSVRNATYLAGEERLPAEGGRVSNAEARRWLGARRGFRSTQHYNSRLGTAGDIERLDSIRDIEEMLKWRSQALSVNWEALLEALGIEPGSVEADRVRADFYGLRWHISELLEDVQRTVGLAKLLRLDPAWFVNRTGELIAAARRDEFLDARRRTAEQQLQASDTDRPESGGSGLSVHPDAVPTRDMIRLALQRRREVRPHPRFSGSNAKMDAYVTDTGRAFTHEHNNKTQALWLQRSDLPESSWGIKKTEYPASALWKNGKYGRHSGLLRYEELAESDLVKVQPRTMAEFEALMDGLCSQ